MIEISKEQACYIREHSNIKVPQTCKFKTKGKRKKYYVEETNKTKRLIEKCNSRYSVVSTYGKYE